jgi:tRNA modification GTPase
MRHYSKLDTIAAIATPPGEGGIAVIRLSGPKAILIASKVCSGNVLDYKSHTVHLSHVLDAKKEIIDEALIIVMNGPRSFTGEDVVEIHCHGGNLIARKILSRLIDEEARLAAAGEFSYRAFKNGKMDLVQAESIQTLISAKNDLALKAAEMQLAGNLSAKIRVLQKKITDIAAIIEAWVDYPEEGLEFATEDELKDELEGIAHTLKTLSLSFHDGKLFNSGLSLCLIGSPNVGKSSLMNALIGRDRAIVTDIPGTTRDLLSEEIRLGSLHFTLTDTAGIRKTEEVVEIEGIKRSKKAAKEADLILLVLDANRGINEEDQALLKTLPLEKTVIIWNKIDQNPSPPFLDAPHIVHTSAKDLVGIEELKQTIHEVIWQGRMPDKSAIVLTKERHYQAVKKALTLVEKALFDLRLATSPEFIAYDLRSSLYSLSQIIGTNVTEDILSSIFANFCVGK